MLDFKKLESFVNKPEKVALIEDSEYSQIKNDDKTGRYPKPCIIDATGKKVEDIIFLLNECIFKGLNTYYKDALIGSKSAKEMTYKINDSKYYIIIRNIDLMSSNPGDWNKLIEIIKSMDLEFRSCLIVLTKSDLSNDIPGMDQVVFDSYRF